MSVVVYIVLTVVIFALLGLVQKLVEDVNYENSSAWCCRSSLRCSSSLPCSSPRGSSDYHDSGDHLPRC